MFEFCSVKQQSHHICATQLAVASPAIFSMRTAAWSRNGIAHI